MTSQSPKAAEEQEERETKAWPWFVYGLGEKWGVHAGQRMQDSGVGGGGVLDSRERRQGGCSGQQRYRREGVGGCVLSRKKKKFSIEDKK